MASLCRTRLLADLVRRKAKPGSILPGERRIAETYGIPLAAVRSVLAGLREDGITETVPRGGSRLLTLPKDTRSLQGRRIGLLGHLGRSPLSYMASTYLLLLALEEELRKQGASLVFLNSADLPQPADLLKAVRKADLDAVIVNQNEHLSGEGLVFSLPAIWISDYPHADLTFSFDQEQIGRAGAECLIRCGHRRIGVACVDELWWSRDRVRAAMELFRENGIDTCEVFSMENETEEETHYDFEKNLPRLAEKYTALMLPNDLCVIRLLKAARKLGIRIPGDLSVIGVDDYLFHREWDLTTVQRSSMFDVRRMIPYLKKMILENVRYPEGKTILLKASVTWRETVRMMTPQEQFVRLNFEDSANAVPEADAAESLP